MHARATTIRVGQDVAEDAIDQYRNALTTFRGIEGNRGAFLLVDRTSGRGIGVTLWESEQAMVDSREQADQLRQQAAEQARGQIESVEEYEIAVWDVDQ
jgi:heme-degrading monooxygenase HmoA